MLHTQGNGYDFDRTMINKIYADEKGMDRARPHRVMALLNDGTHIEMHTHATEADAIREMGKAIDMLNI